MLGRRLWTLGYDPLPARTCTRRLHSTWLSRGQRHPAGQPPCTAQSALSAPIGASARGYSSAKSSTQDPGAAPLESRRRATGDGDRPFFRAPIQSGPAWITLSPAGRKLEADIKSGAVDPLVMLKDALRNDTQDLELVKACLTGYERTQLMTIARGKRADLIRAEKLGGLTLHWLWKDTERWFNVLEYDVALFHTLAYFLVAEGLQKYLMGMLRIEKFDRPGLNSQWRGQVFRCLIQALLHTDLTNSADRALDVFFELYDDIVRARSARTVEERRCSKDHFNKTSVWPPIVPLMSGLASLDFTKTSNDRYQRFEKLVTSELNRRPLKAQILPDNLAKLALWRPKDPDPDPYLMFLKERSQPYGVLEGSSDGPGIRAHVFAQCHRLRTVLLEQARAEDAAWVESVLEKSFPKTERAQFNLNYFLGTVDATSKVRKLYASDSTRNPTPWKAQDYTQMGNPHAAS